ALRNAHLLDEAREASALKSEFLATMAHELRTPLNVMLGYLEMPLDEDIGSLTDGQTDALRRTRQQSLALLEMITALLDLNRFEAGRLPVQRAPVPIGGLLHEVMQQVPETWRRPEVELRLDVAPLLPALETDAGKLKTVVRNLLHNALKFTERGHVTLAGDVTASGDLVITVTDTGRGIPADALGDIFEMFHQVPGTGGGGVGLGLHIVRRFVDVLGGRVEVKSTLGKGSTFTITFPTEPGRVAAPSAPPNVAAHAA